MTEERVERLFLAVDEAQLEPDPGFVERLRRTVHDEATGDADSYINAVDEDTGERIANPLEPSQPSDRRRPGYRGPLGIAAALLMVVAVAAVALIATRDDDSTVATAPPDPQSVVDAYFGAYNSGDADGVVALLTPDATFSSQFPGDSAHPVDSGIWEQRVHWNTAQGTMLTPPACVPVDDQPDEGTTISCEYDRLDAPTQAVHALPVAVTTRFTVGATGISEIFDRYGLGTPGGDFFHVGNPFGLWLQANHTDQTCLAVFGGNRRCEEWANIGWTSVARAREDGVLVAQYAREWATYLEANNCTYLERC